MGTKERIVEALNSMTAEKGFEVYNQWDEDYNYCEPAYEFDIYTFDAVLADFVASDIARMVIGADRFQLADRYFRIDDLQHLETTDDPLQDWADVEEIADDIMESPENYRRIIPDIVEIADEGEEEEEDAE